jgi:hypothetical protein
MRSSPKLLSIFCIDLDIISFEHGGNLEYKLNANKFNPEKLAAHFLLSIVNFFWLSFEAFLSSM